jgi:hypothetical protein
MADRGWKRALLAGSFWVALAGCSTFLGIHDLGGDAGADDGGAGDTRVPSADGPDDGSGNGGDAQGEGGGEGGPDASMDAVGDATGDATDGGAADGGGADGGGVDAADAADAADATDAAQHDAAGDAADGGPTLCVVGVSTVGQCRVQ